MKKLLTLGCLLAATTSFAQTGNVGIGTINPKAQLHTTGTVRFDTLRGAGVRPVYVNDSGSLVTGNTQFASSYTPYAIPDADCAGASSPITVTGMPAAVPSGNIQVRINITHGYDLDLIIYLISPAGQILNLAYHNGNGSNQNFANTVFSDAATMPLSSGTAPYTGSFKPVGNTTAIGTIYSFPTTTCPYAGTVTSFAGFGATVVPNGTWTLKVIDYDAAIVGTIDNWSISFNGSGNFIPPVQPISNNYLPKGTSAGTLVNSSIYDNGSIGIATASPMADLDIVGDTMGIRNSASYDNLWFTVDAGTANINASGADNGLNIRVGNNSTGAYGNGQMLTTAMTMMPTGNVGLGNTNPAARLHVADSSVLFSAAGLVPAASGNPPASGTGRRMMWYPGKAAFRAGAVSGTQWDKDSIGNYSFAAGIDARAKGLAATALGSTTNAGGDYSFASGLSSVAAAQSSTTMGQNSYAAAPVAVAIGFIDTATGTASAAIGAGSMVRSWGEVAAGIFNTDYVPASTTGIQPADRVFTVGNGTSATARSNALTILKNGSTGIGTATPAGRLVVVAQSISGIDTAAAIYGYANGTPGSAKGGVYGTYNTSYYGTGVQGVGYNGVTYQNLPAVLPTVGASQDIGVYGSATNGVIGTSTIASGVKGYGLTYGVYGSAVNTTTSASSRYGVYGISAAATGVSNNYGVYGTASGGSVNYAGYFAGNVAVTGSMSKASGTFKIDHPLDPENKYLYHSFVESPDMMNVYNGNITLDAAGHAVVTLPEYFEALNKDFRYQLTPIGAPAQLYIARKVSGNTFEIAGGGAGLEVSWQVTGVRKDAYANAHRVVPEVEKEAANKGLYLHPTEWSQPESKGIDQHQAQVVNDEANTPRKLPSAGGVN